MRQTHHDCVRYIHGMMAEWDMWFERTHTHYQQPRRENSLHEFSFGQCKLCTAHLFVCVTMYWCNIIYQRPVCRLWSRKIPHEETSHYLFLSLIFSHQFFLRNSQLLVCHVPFIVMSSHLTHWELQSRTHCHSISFLTIHLNSVIVRQILWNKIQCFCQPKGHGINYQGMHKLIKHIP